MAPSVVDLFAGAGGFTVGFHMAGFRTLAALEVDDWAVDTLIENGIPEKVLHMDVQDLVTESDVTHHFGMITPDVVIGGPPCQGFSKCVKGNGDPKDPRNSLFIDFLRVAKALKPKIILMENVPDIVKAKTKSGEYVVDVIRNELKSNGYPEVNVKVLKATEYGVPQIRERLFILASSIGVIDFPQSRFTPNGRADLPSTPTLWDAISDLPQIEAREGAEISEYSSSAQNDYQKSMRNGSQVLFNHKAMNHYRTTVERFKAMKWGMKVADLPPELRPKKRGTNELAEAVYDQNNRRMRPDLPCHTIPASFYANFVHPFCDRNFTAREGARIQSFPDWYRFMGKPTVVSRKLLHREGRKDEAKLCQYNQIGNAVPPLLAKAIAEQINQELRKLERI